MTEKNMTVLEVAEFLRCAPETVRRKWRAGVLRGSIPCKRLLIPQSEVERLLRERGNLRSARGTRN
jgi:excisionase family DNA binding protein